MPTGSLSSLQARILRVLAGMDPPWVLSGGAALSGFHLKHRMTRDLDLFWRGRGMLGHVPDLARGKLVADGFQVDTLQRARARSTGSR